MSKICFLIHNWSHTGGTERVSASIANGLSKQGFDVHLLSIWGDGSPSFALVENIVGSQLVEGSQARLFQKMAVYLKVRRYVKRHAITHLIIVESMVALIGLPALALSSCKTIVWEHFNYSIDLGRKTRSYARSLAAIMANHIVVLTNRDRDLWVQQGSVSPSKISVVSNPIPFDKVQKSFIDRTENKTMIAVGRLTYQKGFDLLIESATPLLRKYPSWRLLIIGSGEDEQLLRSQIDRAGVGEQIQLIPNTSSISEYYCRASFLVMSSRFEGLPMVLLESLSYGLPILSFDCLTGPSEIVEHGLNGFLAEDGNIVDLRTNMERLISEEQLLPAMGMQALKKSENFSIDKVLQQWRKILV
ncbi:glycosyltransferase family 4 protein [Sphingobacterium chungjuense]|uniref:glycosyltransferase family 4 protein n=1 Tax=Sphingobacterium chungjuense TaxID=2675553 RepID=UPI00140E11E5|nr:glycosyltransferase family 4 protein [Sphingobacterium chungjuense]